MKNIGQSDLREEIASGISPMVSTVVLNDVVIGGEKLPASVKRDLGAFIEDSLESSAWFLYVDGSDAALDQYPVLASWLRCRMEETARAIR